MEVVIKETSNQLWESVYCNNLKTPQNSEKPVMECMKYNLLNYNTKVQFLAVKRKGQTIKKG